MVDRYVRPKGSDIYTRPGAQNVPPLEYVDIDFNAIKDYLNYLAEQIETIEGTGVAVTVDDINKFLTTADGTTTLFSKVTNNHIGDNTISGTKLTNSSFPIDKIDTTQINHNYVLKTYKNAFDTYQTQWGLVTADYIGTGEVTAAKIENGAVTAAKIENGAVTAAKIENGAVTAAKIGNNSVYGNHIANNAIGNQHIANGAVTAAKIENNSIYGNHIANGAITSEKLSFQGFILSNIFIDMNIASYSPLVFNGTQNTSIFIVHCSGSGGTQQGKGFFYRHNNGDIVTLASYQDREGALIIAVNANLIGTHRVWGTFIRNSFIVYEYAYFG